MPPEMLGAVKLTVFRVSYRYSPTKRLVCGIDDWVCPLLRVEDTGQVSMAIGDSSRIDPLDTSAFPLPTY
jgi:hypothetical protein